MRVVSVVIPLVVLCACPGPGSHVLPGGAPAKQQPPTVPPVVAPPLNPPVAPPVTPPAAGCAQAPLVVLRETQLLTVNVAGEETPLFQFGASTGHPADAVVVQDWQQQPGFLGAVAFLHDPPSAHRYEFVLLRADGTVLFHHVEEQPHNPDIFLSPQGSLAVSGEHNFVAFPDGRVTELGGYSPAVPSMDGQHILVSQGPSWRANARYGWLRLMDLAFTPLARTAEWMTFVVVGNHVMALPHDGQRSGPLLRTSPGLETVVAAELTTNAALDVVSQAGGRWLLLQRSADSLVRVNVEDGTASVVDGMLGARQLWGVWTASVATDGSIQFSTAREDGLLQLQRTADLGATFVDVGQPMEAGPDMGLGARLVALRKGDNTLILNLSSGYGDFLQEVQLVSAEGVQRESTGGLYVNADIHPGAADLSGDGSCVATVAQRQGTAFSEDSIYELVFLDAVTGTRTVHAWEHPYQTQLRFLQRP
jgi:hypothetical protein